MARKYGVSVTLKNAGQFGSETFTIEGCDSFDEALKDVNKAVYNRSLELELETKKNAKQIVAQKGKDESDSTASVPAGNIQPSATESETKHE